MNLEDVNSYFASLSDYEKYAWLAVALGVVIVVVGIILW
jgi:hypothetical protein